MMTDPTAWTVRFVPPNVLTPFVRENEYQYHPAVLQRAAEALGYLPWSFWQVADCAGPGPCWRKTIRLAGATIMGPSNFPVEHDSLAANLGEGGRNHGRRV